jgi:hypothetical protein
MASEEKGRGGYKLPLEIGGKMGEMLKKKLTDALVDGFGSLFMSEELVARIMDEMRLPRELIGTIMTQTERARRGLTEVLKGEVRRFLEGIDISKELNKLLSSMVLEVKTEIRFIPAEDGSINIKPSKKSRFSIYRNGKKDPEVGST